MSNPYIFKAIVSKIVDGDTMYVTDISLGFGQYNRGDTGRGICLRLNGIDTPESRTRDLEEKQYGLAANAFVQAFSPVGTEVTLRTYKKGKYGRWRADIKVGNKWLCKELIKNHHAVEYEGQNKKEIQEAHLLNRSRVILDVS